MTAPTTPRGGWRYESATKTIRSVPENYWIASMDSFDGAVDHKANARLIAAAPTLVDVLETMMRLEQTQGVSDDDWDACWERARAVLRQVRGEE